VGPNFLLVNSNLVHNNFGGSEKSFTLTIMFERGGGSGEVGIEQKRKG
jgi:hypothetical protein